MLEEESKHEAVKRESKAKEEEVPEGLSVEMKVVNTEEDLKKYMKELAKESPAYAETMKHLKNFQQEVLHSLDDSKL